MRQCVRIVILEASGLLFSSGIVIGQTFCPVIESCGQHGYISVETEKLSFLFPDIHEESLLVACTRGPGGFLIFQTKGATHKHPGGQTACRS